MATGERKGETEDTGMAIPRRKIEIIAKKERVIRNSISSPYRGTLCTSDKH